MEFNITEPLTLAVGAHVKGMGYGCAMEVLSWTQGGEFTDHPANVNWWLAAMVQCFNDEVGQNTPASTIQVPNGTTDSLGSPIMVNQMILYPEHAIMAFELATMVVDTAPKLKKIQARDHDDAWISVIPALREAGLITPTDVPLGALVSTAANIVAYTSAAKIHMGVEAEDVFEWCKKVILTFREVHRLNVVTIPAATDIDRALVRIRERAV